MNNRKRWTIVLLIFLGCLVFALVLSSFYMPNTTLDIALYDTYFVFDASAVLLSSALLIFFLGSLIHAIWKRFSDRAANILLMLSAAFLIIYVFRLLSSP